MIDKGALYIVATPIGNLDDISARALSVLRAADVIAAEDTRHSQRLLFHFGIEQRLVAHHDYSSDQQTNNVLDMLRDGLTVALISDAGTPLISDPGYRLVQRARDLDIKVVPIPGPSAPITALSASGLATDRFTFEGFLPSKTSARRKCFEAVKSSNATSIFFESPHRIVDSIDDAVDTLGEAWPAVLARELTKTFETFLGSTLGEIQTAIQQDANQKRGEMVLMLGSVARNANEESDELPEEHRRIIDLLSEELPTKQAATLASKITGNSKKRFYDYVLSQKSN